MPAVLSFSIVDAAVFLDRDNTLIHNDGDLGDPDKVRLKDGVAEGLKALRVAGYRLVVITNQGGVARGRYTEADVDAVNQRIATEVEQVTKQRPLIDRFYYCPYHPDGEIEEYRRDHPWRKPHPGMLLQAARDLNIDLSTSWVIGDQLRDVQAGRTAGCRTIMICEDEQLIRQCKPTAAVADFAAAVELIMKQTAEERPLPNGASLGTGGPKTLRQPGMRAGAPADVMDGSDGAQQLRRTMLELTEELRTARQRRAEFTPLKMAAGFCQLLVLLMALLGLLQLSNPSALMSWMGFAILMQLFTVTLLLVDSRG